MYKIINQIANIILNFLGITAVIIVNVGIILSITFLHGLMINAIIITQYHQLISGLVWIITAPIFAAIYLIVFSLINYGIKKYEHMKTLLP